MQPINLMKLVVGIDNLADYKAWQKQDRITYKGQKVNTVHTRNMPKQAEENGKKTIFLTDTEVIETQPIPTRAFQGWRYLKGDAPEDKKYNADGTEILSHVEEEKMLEELGLMEKSL